MDWRTPANEDAAKQVEAIEALTRAGVDGMIVSCTDAATLTPAINRAAEASTPIPVMTFDSDAPNSKRFAYYGTDNAMIGKLIVGSLADVMGGKGTIAILGGNQSGTNLAARVTAAKEELAKHPDMKLLEASGGVFYHEETPEKAAEAVTNATNANPGINGWAFIGGWPLFTSNALKWEPGKIKVVSCDALPPQLSYIKSGHVQILYAQDCYGWGHKSVETILEKIVNNKSPETAVMVDPLTKVDSSNVDEYAKKWEQWLPKK
ncbi:MAG: substrate-binding domain-containing protein [Tepidisphaeraceae bacterium]